MAVSGVAKLNSSDRGAICKWLTGVSPAGDEEDKLDIETHTVLRFSTQTK